MVMDLETIKNTCLENNVEVSEDINDMRVKLIDKVVKETERVAHKRRRKEMMDEMDDGEFEVVNIPVFLDLVISSITSAKCV